MSQPTALLLTLAVEVPLYVAALVPLGLASVRRALVVAVLVNLLTNPLLWFALGARPSLPAVALGEVVVWLVEAALIRVTVRRDAPLVALIAAGVNAGSILAGALIAGAV